MADAVGQRLSSFRNTLAGLRREIGGTPLVELWPGELPGHNRLFAKLEYTNPTGSHYDRIYDRLFEADAALLAELQPQMLIEVSSGSAGASFVWFCRALGFPCRVILPASVPDSFLRHIQQFNPEADVVRAVSRKDYLSGAVDELRRELITAKYEGRRIYCPDHSRRAESAWATEQIALESIEQLADQYGVRQMDHAVVAAGNGATIVGMARVLKEAFSLRVSAFEPEQAPFHYNIKYNAHLPKVGQHRLFGTGGWGVGLPLVMDEEKYHYKEIVDEVVLVDEEWQIKAFGLRKRLEHSVGRTSLAGLALALEMMDGVENQNFLILFYDRGEKYDWLV